MCEESLTRAMTFGQEIQPRRPALWDARGINTLTSLSAHPQFSPSAPHWQNLAQLEARGQMVL